jgi:hypothetical protein
MLYSTFLSVAIVGQLALPGSDLSPESAREKARWIVLAEPVRFDIMFGLGSVAFSSVDLKQSVVLKGNVTEEAMKRASIQISGREVFPEYGKEYLVFLDESVGHPKILKMLPKSRENIEAVRMEIAAKQKASR